VQPEAGAAVVAMEQLQDVLRSALDDLRFAITTLHLIRAEPLRAHRLAIALAEADVTRTLEAFLDAFERAAATGEATKLDADLLNLPPDPRSAGGRQ
jgi:hypothetical protein